MTKVKQEPAEQKNINPILYEGNRLKLKSVKQEVAGTPPIPATHYMP